MLEEELVAVCLGHILELDHPVAELRAVRNVDLEVGLLLLSVLAGQFLVCAETGLGLGVACLWSHPDPFQLPLESLAALAFLLLLHCQTLGLLVEP